MTNFPAAWEVKAFWIKGHPESAVWLVQVFYFGPVYLGGRAAALTFLSSWENGPESSLSGYK
jgi:hypothetical protein